MLQRNKSILVSAAVIAVLVCLGPLVRACWGSQGDATLPSDPAPAKAMVSTAVKHETSGEMNYLPGGHRYTATTFEGGKTILTYEPPLPRNDGSVFAAMHHAIPLIYERRAGHYFGSKLSSRNLADGKAVLAIEADEYWYLAMTMGVSDEDSRIAGMVIWREEK